MANFVFRIANEMFVRMVVPVVMWMRTFSAGAETCVACYLRHKIGYNKRVVVSSAVDPLV